MYGGVQLLRSDGQPSPRYPVYLLKAKCILIGSDDKSSIVIKRPEVEPMHAKLTVDDQSAVWLSCLSTKSFSTIQINDNPLSTAKVKLNDKDRFSVAGRAFWYLAPGTFPTETIHPEMTKEKQRKTRAKSIIKTN